MNYSPRESLDKREDILNFSSFNVIRLPSKSSGFISLSTLENVFYSVSGLSCRTLSQMTENICSLLNSRKSSSLVTNTRFSNLENSANFPFDSPFGFDIASYPLEIKKVNKSLFTFSSNRNLVVCWDDNIISSFGNISCELQGCFDMFFCKRDYETGDDIINRDSCFKHLQNLPDHDSGSFESRLSMANLSVCDNILIYFNSHNLDDEEEVYKYFI